MAANNMKIPTRSDAERLLAEGGKRNPGPWIDHSRHVAVAAEAIASHTEHLDADEVYILGLLHDIGRQEGQTNMRHTLDGYTFLMALGYEDSARICLTHSFAMQDIHAHAGIWDCQREELDFMTHWLAGVTYCDSDRLIQLCDAMALASGICLLETRLVDVALRHGINEFTLPRWRAFFNLKAYFDNLTGQSIYNLLPGVVQTTFNFSP